MASLTTTPIAPDSNAIAAAAAALREGRLVGMPTETVYGLACDATNPAAAARVFAAKARPRINPLIVHCANIEQAFGLVDPTPAMRALAAAFWPGPLTLIGDRRPHGPIADLVSAGLDTLAVRAPAHPIAQALLDAVGRPLAAPSANRSGRLTATDAQAAAVEIGADTAFVLDGGPCALGLESTVIDARSTPATLLRSGAIARAAIEAVCGPLRDPDDHTETGPRAPGRLLRHYAPDRPIRLNAEAPYGPDEALLAFGAIDAAGYARIIQLSELGDLNEAAARLFSALRALDAPPVRAIAVSPIPDAGLGEAINDRLRRAAAAQGGEE